MKKYNLFILSLLSLFLIASGGCGDDKGGKKETETITGNEVTTQKIKTYTYDWSAICRCHGETVTQGKLCSSKGTYTGQHESEVEVIEKMKEDVRQKMNCKEGPFLSFRYETR
ncbi:MAG: hypothetical protein ISS66_10530 [Desulfobacteraceae bacterium]|nr:hypothetical protein [Desulfobacteraceae bacterium]